MYLQICIPSLGKTWPTRWKLIDRLHFPNASSQSHSAVWVCEWYQFENVVMWKQSTSIQGSFIQLQLKVQFSSRCD